MKILKIFGIVVGIHVFALVLIFANPGCSSTSIPPPAPADTVTAAPPSPTPPPDNSVPAAPPSYSAPTAPLFNPDAPAVASSGTYAGGASPTVRYTPTRPGTPVATTLVVEPVADVTPATTYTVKSGDSLWTIAKKHQLTVAQLTAANSLASNVVLKAGQKLIIPSASGSTALAAAPGGMTPPAKAAKANETTAAKSATAANGAVKHVVKSGETLGGIARTYGVKMGDIAVANNIDNPAKIRPGMELVIPGWEAPAKRTKSGAAKAAPAATPQSAPPPPSTPPTINFDVPANTAPQVPVISIDDGAGVRPAPKTP